MAQAPRSGLFQYLKWGAVSANTSAGVVDGGDLNINPDLRVRLGIGGTEIRKGGVVVPMGTATAYITDTNQALFGAAGIRASYPRGALTDYEFEGGLDEFAILYHDAIITDWSINYSRGDGLKGTVNWGALGVGYNATGGSMTEETAESLEDYEFVIEYESNQYYVNELSISGANNVTFLTSGNTKTAGQRRLPTHYVVGAEELTVGLSTDIPLPLSGMNMYEDCIPGNLGIVATGTGCDNTAVITLTNLAPSEAVQMSFVDASTEAGFGYGFRGSSWDGSFAWSWT